MKNAAPDLNVVGGIGLSLGEYPALIASSMLDFETGMKLVSKRAEFMQEDCDRHQSSMAAVLKPDVELVEKSVPKFRRTKSRFRLPTIIRQNKSSSEAMMKP